MICQDTETASRTETGGTAGGECNRRGIRDDDTAFASAKQSAMAMMLESAIEMYRTRGYPPAEAERLAKALVNSPSKHRLPTIDEL
jgi:hypothetical protein